MGQEGKKLTIPGASNIFNAQSSSSVALSADGNTAIVGTDQENGNVGAVRFYTRTGTAWAQQGPAITASDASGAPHQGYSVSLSADGNTAVVGGYLDSNPLGAAYVFTRSGGVWTQQGPKLVGTGSAMGSIQGWSVAISGDGNTIVVGGQGDQNYTGAVWVFTRSAGVWTQQGDKIVGSGNVGTSAQGQSVSISHDGNTFIAGAKNDNGNTGAAWIFSRSGSVWSQVTKLVGSGNAGQSWQGISVGISGDGNSAIVGGYLDNSHVGAAWIFTKSGGVWSQQGNKLVANDYTGNTQQGNAVSLSYDGNKALVGGWNDNSALGCAWLYTRSGGVWTQSGNKMKAGDNVGVVKFGSGLALSADGSTAIMNGPYDNSSAGGIWVFSNCTTDPPKAAITGADSEAICSGYVLTVSDTSTVGKFISSYSWSDGSTSATSNPITANGTYTVTITNSCGYTSTVSQVITSIKASPAPVINGLPYFCTGSAVTLTVSDANATAGPLSYNWSNGSVLSASNPINTAGTYSVSLTNGFGCAVSASQLITSNPISISSTGGSGAAGLCYTNLKAGFDAINNGVHTGIITILVLGNTTETASCVLNASGNGSASYTSILMKPSGGAARTITGALSNFALIELNGADNVVIDGLNSKGDTLSLINTSIATSLGTSTIRFINDANNNKVTRCTILGNAGGSVGNVGGGTIVFSTALATGNDNNTISYCNIGSTHSTSMATRHIYAGGTTGMENDGLVIDNNYIGNFFRSNLSSSAIDIANGTTGVTISNNKFHQSATRAFTTVNLFHRAININNTSGNGYQVLNNRIGYADTSGTGVYTFNFSNASSTTAMFNPIYLNVGTTTASSVQGNIVASISIGGNSIGTAAGAPFKAIYVVSGLVTIGDITGNTIGSMSGSGNITYTSLGSSPADVIGILVNGSSNSLVSNNSIGGITVNTSVAAARNFYGIRSIANAATSMVCENNTIGGDIANSIRSTANQNASKMNGILIAGPTGSLTGNTIRNMTTSIGNGTASNAGMAGIVLTGTTDQTVVNNKVYNLSNTATTVAEMNGIFVGTSGINRVERNLVYGLSATSTAGIALSGIYITTGTGTYSNNMTAIGEGVTIPATINGLNETGGTNNIWNNSVYIGGAPALGTASSYGIFSTVTANIRSIQNNIFFNARSNAGEATGKHFSASLTDATGLTINNNLYLASGTGNTFGRINSADVADLAAWKLASGQDANSITGDPGFKDPAGVTPDLHINSDSSLSIVDAAGTDLSVAIDFDGETRASLTPTDMGADAFISITSVWQGTADTKWSNTANWSGGVLPTAVSNVTIPAIAPNMPVVDITDAYSNDLTIASGASLIVGVSNELEVNGAINNNGTFSVLGTINFSGTAQTIPAGTYANIAISDSGTKTLAGTVIITDLLTLHSGLVELGAYDLTVGSAGSITGGSSSSYIISSGTGALKQQGVGTGGRTGTISFPVGTSASFTPLSINNTGTSDEFSVRVITDVFDAYDNNDLPTGTAQTENNVNRTWILTEAVPGGSIASLGFQWNSSEELPGFNRTLATPSHYSNGTWVGGTLSAASGSDPYTISMTGITSFSPFGIGSINSVLPLTLVSFTGKETADAMILKWTTANEVNTDGFDVERSVNGGSFVTQGSIASNNMQAYSYTDTKITPGSVYVYRLKMRDRDGKYTYSATISFTYAASAATGFSVYPNPAVGANLYVKPLSIITNVQLAVVDMNGRMWYTGNVSAGSMSNGRFEIPVKQLPAGSYVLRISDKNGNRLQVTKFAVVK